MGYGKTDVKKLRNRLQEELESENVPIHKELDKLRTEMKELSEKLVKHEREYHKNKEQP